MNIVLLQNEKPIPVDLLSMYNCNSNNKCNPINKFAIKFTSTCHHIGALNMSF